MVVLGFIMSAFVSFIAVRWLLRYIQTHTLMFSDGTALRSELAFYACFSSITDKAH